MPKGNFQGASTYGNAYLETHGERPQQFHPEGELKVGGNHFEGSSSYAKEFQGKTPSKREKITYKNNEIMPRGQF